jgi:hypothetical protein
MKEIFKKYKLTADLFNEKNAQRINLNHPKVALEEGLNRSIRHSFNTLVVAIQRALKPVNDPGFTKQGVYLLVNHGTSLYYTCTFEHIRGCSFIYKKLIDEKAKQRWIMMAPAYFTWTNKIQHGMCTNEWYNALEGIGKIHISPGAKWNSIQIFFHTIWTLLKSLDASGGELCDECLNYFH